MDLKLFSQLQGQNTASIILFPITASKLQYFLISDNFNNSIVVSGTCSGELKTEQPMSFDVVLSSVTPLLDKNVRFEIDCDGGVVRFTEVNGKFSITPLCVEHIADGAHSSISKFKAVTSMLTEHFDSVDRLRELTKSVASKEESLQVNEEQANLVKEMCLDSVESPGGVSDYDVNASYLKRTRETVRLMKEEIATLQEKVGIVREVDFSPLKKMASIASRFNTTVSMCDDFAIVNLSSSFVLQKGNFGTRAIQGKLLSRLLSETSGKFYQVGEDLVFVLNSASRKLPKSSNKSHVDDTLTCIFLHPYLPNLTVDTTIITKGSVREKYKINIKDISGYMTTLCSKFDDMVFHMGTSTFCMSNDRGEELRYVFHMEDLQNIELSKAMKSGVIADVSMADISIPKELQRVFGDMGSDLTFYVKDRKIILQSDKLWAVFGR